MSLLDKIIYELDEQNANTPFYQNDLEDIKNNIKVLLNTSLDDCIILNDSGMSSNILEMNLNSNELCSSMSKEICNLIGKPEKRIQITTMSYDNSLSPWQLSFLLGCVLTNDKFQNLSIELSFKNNRYCEVV